MIKAKFAVIGTRKSFTLEFEPETTIQQIKEKLATDKFKCEPQSLALLLKKRTLKDDETLKSLNLGSKDRIYVIAPQEKTKAEAEATPTPTLPIECEEVKIANYKQDLRTNIEKIVMMGLNKNEYDEYLLKGPKFVRPTGRKMYTLPDYSLDDTMIQRNQWYVQIIKKMLEKNPQTLEKLVSVLENANEHQVVRDYIRQNPQEFFLNPCKLDPGNFDLLGIRNRTIEISDEEFLRCYYQAHKEFIDAETDRIWNDESLEAETGSHDNFLRSHLISFLNT